MTISRGSRVRRYEITAPLGAGGMGEVFLARDVELDRTVALKVLSDAPDADGERNRRFVQEARAAIALNHPNVAHVYDAGEEHGVRFLAMEYVEGETLRARLARERMTPSEALEIAIQVAAALASAHALGIVHRDIKPENVMIRPDGYVKVLDFGLAKLTARIGSPESPTLAVHTAPGLVMGTMQYMSPEQLRTDDVDARSDVFSLGVVLYEMISGRRPFEASTPSGVIAAILTDEPPPLDASLPPAIHAILSKALAKNRDQRFPSGKELAEALKSARHETARIRSGDVPTQALTQLVITPKRKPWTWIVAAVALVAAIAIGGYFVNRARLVRDARARLPELGKLAENRQYFAAWDLATELSETLPGDPAIARALEKVGGTIDVKSEPAGAEVFLERVNADASLAPKTRAGATPLAKFALPLGDYVLRVEKNGFAPIARTISLAPIPSGDLRVPQPPPVLDLKLIPAKDAPPRMVHVGGAKRYRLTAWDRPTTAAVALDDFFIDQFEVTNREFAEFIRAGGYERRELWKHPFVKDGRTLTFEEAMAELKDTTGANAPRSWVNQAYPEGRDDYPVTGVTWYEAAAYAEHRGKSLPTLFQWDKAARDGRRTPFGQTFPWGIESPGAGRASKRSNFSGTGTVPVASHPSGMSSFGAYNMAGNAAEWCLNRLGGGMAASGANFNEPTYMFGNVGSYPAFHSSATIGFRCARVAGAPRGDQGAMALSRSRVRVELHPVGDAEYATIERLYDYPPAPLNARVAERQTAEAWIREKIEFDGANGERAWGYLYLPRYAKPPFQVIHFVPAGDVANGARSLDESMEAILAPFIRGGRAAFGVVLTGYIGRPEQKQARRTEEEYVETTAARMTDLRRGVDYLVTRPEIDRGRIAFWGPSAGGYIGIILAALEKRYRSVALEGVGISPDEMDAVPAASRINFAPHIRAPKVMLQGRWDEAHPLEAHAMPLYELLAEPKKLVVYDGGHIPTHDVMVRLLNSWFDETLGKVPR
jgi:eukaryotic-like serine/threonine-protein kinase